MQPPSRLFRSRSRAAALQEPYSSSAAFRAALLAASSRRRTLCVGDRVFRFTATERGGNCGFQAVAWALIIAGRGGPAVSSKWVRAVVARAVRQEREYWATRVGEREGALAPLLECNEEIADVKSGGRGTQHHHTPGPPKQEKVLSEEGQGQDGEDGNRNSHAGNVCNVEKECKNPETREGKSEDCLQHGLSCNGECGCDSVNSEDGRLPTIAYNLYRDEDGTSVSHGDTSEENSAPPSNRHGVFADCPMSPSDSACDTDARSCITSPSVGSGVAASATSTSIFSPAGNLEGSSASETARNEVLENSELEKKRWHARVVAFEKSVLSTGINGHWLGQCWGDLELSVLARALDIRIELFAFDTRSQQARSYHVDGDPSKLKVSLLFTGTAEAGHFDLLQEEHGGLHRRKRSLRNS